MMKSLMLACALMLMIGCSDSSVDKKSFAKAIEDDQPMEKMPPVAAAKPAKTDPAAESVIVNLILAHTKNAPSALAAFKTCIVKRSGEMNAGSGTMMAASFTDRIQWPDRYRAEWLLQGMPPMTMAFHGDKHWQHCTKLSDDKTPIDTNALATVIADRDATLMTLLVPLNDAADRVAMPMPASDMPPGLTGVRVWIRKMEPMVLGIDAKTGLLSRIYFDKPDIGRTATWRYQLKDLQIVNGVLLPTKMTYSAGQQNGAEWTKIEYELPTAIDAAVFEKP